MSSSNKALEIVCRISPVRQEDESCVERYDSRHVTLVPPAGAVSRNGEVLVPKYYKFAHVHDSNDSQSIVFDRCAKDMVQDLFAGSSSLLFAYGVTGSGKTFTITGTVEEKNSGLLPRSLDAIFAGVNHRLVEKCIFKPDGKNGFYIQDPSDALRERNRVPSKIYESSQKPIARRGMRGLNADLCCTVYCSYVEIYNDEAYDLFDEADDRRIKAVRQDPFTGAAYVEGIKEIEMHSTDEVMESFLRAQKKRCFAATMLNTNSSRSHSVFTIRLVTAACGEQFYPEGSIHISEFVVVDLAGSERAKRTGHDGERMVESSKINQSLSVLRHCFEKLRENRKRKDPVPVPYRDCKLTRLFKSFFEGRGRIRMIVCVNARTVDYEENVFVMNFAELANKAKVVAPKASIFELGELHDLPFTFREQQQWETELYQAVGKLEPSTKSLFKKSPPIQLRGCDDDESINNMRDYFTEIVRLRSERCNAIINDSSEFMSKLKKRLCFADLTNNSLMVASEDLDKSRKVIEKLANEGNLVRKENDALRVRLAKYEAEYSNIRRREDEGNARAMQENAIYENQRRKLKQVENIFDTPPLSSASSSSFYQVPPSRNHFENEQMTRSEKPPMKKRNQSRGPAAAAPRLTTQTPAALRPRPNPGHVDSRFNRRSQSAGRVMDHQSNNRVPSGTVFQPNLPKNTHHTTRPSSDDLKKCTGYVLKSQIVDSRGNLKTDLYKGRVVPTAGGGSAVMFDDKEELTLDSM